jgi:hypothetical protein
MTIYRREIQKSDMEMFKLLVRAMKNTWCDTTLCQVDCRIKCWWSTQTQQHCMLEARPTYASVDSTWSSQGTTHHTHCHTLTHSYSHILTTLSYTHTLTYSHSLLLSHTHSLSHALTFTHSLTCSHTHSHSLTYSLTHPTYTTHLIWSCECSHGRYLSVTSWKTGDRKHESMPQNS